MKNGITFMPFGMYAGERMQDVPPAYLLWLWENGKKNEVQIDPVAKYIHGYYQMLVEQAEAEDVDDFEDMAASFDDMAWK